MSSAVPAIGAGQAMTLPHQQVSIDAHILPEIIEAYFAAKAPDIGDVTMSNYRIQLMPFMAFWEKRTDLHQYHLSPAILSAAVEWIKTEHRNTLGNKPMLIDHLFAAFVVANVAVVVEPVPVGIFGSHGDDEGTIERM